MTTRQAPGAPLDTARGAWAEDAAGGSRGASGRSSVSVRSGAVACTTIRTLVLWALVIGFGAFNVVSWYAWLVVGILQGVMAPENAPGRPWG